jgi:hypothetical protein
VHRKRGAAVCGTELAECGAAVCGTELAECGAVVCGTELAKCGAAVCGTERAKCGAAVCGTELAKSCCGRSQINASELNSINILTTASSCPHALGQTVKHSQYLTVQTVLNIGYQYGRLNVKNNEK